MSLHAFTDQFTRSLDTDLTAVADRYPYRNVPQQEMRRSISAYREVLADNRRKVGVLHEKNWSGSAVCAILSTLIDRFIIHVCSIYDICTSSNPGLAVIALGGYGRCELNPYSDIDLLFLTREKGSGFYETEVTSMIQFLWDVVLDIGHSTRTISECIDAAHDDTHLATSLLESRFLTGDKEVWKEFRDQYDAWLREGAGKQFAMQKIEDRNSRLKYYRNTVQIQVPNIKESPGTLRDVHVARWIIMLTGLGGTFEDLHREGLLYDYEVPVYQETFDYLLRVRNTLHFTAAKKTDLLEHLILPEIARSLHYPGHKTRPAERFMRDYYRRAGQVFRLTNHIIGRFMKRHLPSRTYELKPGPPGLVFIGDRVGFLSTHDDVLRRNPVYLIRIFAGAGARGFDLTGYASSLVEKTIAGFKGYLTDNRAVCEEFHEMVDMKQGLGKSLRLMHEHGVLGKLIPEFDSISWHYQYNRYHAYTTDEHSVRVVEHLQRMESGGFPNMPELTEIMTDVTAKGALYLAGLLHDIGKGAGKRNHAVIGERMAASALERLGFDERTVMLVRFLVREHLLMTHISQRRDMDDENTIKDFARQVRSTGRLRMLTLLTFADLMAVSEHSLTEWKKTLLFNLYSRGMKYLEKGYEKLFQPSGERIVEKVMKRHSRSLTHDMVRTHLAHMPEQYIRVTSPAGIRLHLRGIERMKRLGVWSVFRHAKDTTLLTVITRDFPKALAEISETITASDISILGAQIFTRTDRIIIDTFMVVDEHGGPLIPRENQKRFKENISRVISGEINVHDLVETHRNRWKRRRTKVIYAEPRVRIHNDVSERYTVIDVFATNYSGLLYTVASVFGSFNIDIHTAKIGTDEDQVADAFYVQKNGGGKITDEDTITALKKALMEKLEEEYRIQDK